MLPITRFDFKEAAKKKKPPVARKKTHRETSIEDINVSDGNPKFITSWKDIIFIPFRPYVYYTFIAILVYSLMNSMFLLTYRPKIPFAWDVINITIEYAYAGWTVLITMHKAFAHHRERKIFKAQPLILIIFDYVSILPVETYLSFINRFSWEPPFGDDTIYYKSRYLKMARVFRLIYFLQELRNNLALNQVLVITIAHLITTAVICAISGAILYSLSCFGCKELNWTIFYDNVSFDANSLRDRFILVNTVVIGLLYHNSSLSLPNYSMKEMILVSAIMFIGMNLQNMFLIGQLITEYIQSMHFKMFFEYRLFILNRFMKLLDFTQSLQDSINEYYKIIWHSRNGLISKPKMMKMFPLETKIIISFDIYFAAILHSQIFSRHDIRFKKHLSMCFETAVYTPGQFIYKTNALKHEMVYIHSGILEVMSYENSDSPILSFSTGTILGELSCLLPTKATANVRCSTSSVLHILRHRNLLEVLKNHPETAKELSTTISGRISYAQKKIKRIHKIPNPISHIYWIKDQWRKLATELYTKQNVPKATYNPYYCTKYLSLLVLSTYDELKVHSICIRGKCSFVMEERTSFHQFLHLLCLFGVMLHLLLTFHMICFEGQIYQNYVPFLVLLDSLYFFDIYIQAITAMWVNNILVTKPSDILLHRFREFTFLLDLFATLPYDYFAFLMDQSRFTLAMCRLPKYIKLYKVIQYFKRKESELTFNIKLVTALKFFSILTLAIILITSASYMVNCLEHRCLPEGWIAKVKRYGTLYNTLEIPTDFELSLFHSTSVFLNLAMDLPNFGSNWDRLTDAIMKILGYYVLTIALVQFCSCVALQYEPRHTYLNYLSYLEATFRERKAIRAYKQEIMQFVDLQWTNSSNMLFQDIPALMDHESSYIRRMINNEFVNDCFKRTRLFSIFSDDFQKLLAPKTRLFTIPEGHTLLDFDDRCVYLYVILKGYCEVRSCVPHDVEECHTMYYSKDAVFPVVEFFHQVESFLHIKACTTVQLLCLSLFDFEMVQRALRHDNKLIADAIILHKKANENLIMRITHLPLLEQPSLKSRKPTHIFNYNLDHKNTFLLLSLAWLRKHMSFLGSYRSWLKKLIYTTYDPQGTGYLIYESYICLRLLYLQITNFMLLSNTYMKQERLQSISAYFYLATYLLDLFVRAHLQYYTDQGIKVTRPISTWKNYYRHSFFVDLIAGFPIRESFIIKLLHRGSAKKVEILILAHTRPFLLYRPFQLISYLCKTYFAQRAHLIRSIMFSYFLVLTSAHLATYLLLWTCDLSENKDYQCSNSSWIKLISNWNYIEANDYIILVIFHQISTLNILRSKVADSFKDMTILLLLAVMVLITHIVYSCVIIGYNVFGNENLASYQDKRKQYMKFVAWKKVDQNAVRTLLQHYDNMWKKSFTDQPSEIFASFYPYLREQIHLALYLDTLLKVKVFEGIRSSLFCFLVPHLKELNFTMGAEIIRCNDIISCIYIVLNGSVQVTIAGYEMTNLGQGGMFGCFESKGITRLTINVVTKMHTTLLQIETKQFYEMAKYYRNISIKMQRLNYVQAQYVDSIDVALDEVGKKIKKKVNFVFGETLSNQSSPYLVYEYFKNMHLAPICSIMSLLHSTMHFGIKVYPFWVVTDLFFFAGMYLKSHVSYTDINSGLTLTNVKDVTKRYMKSVGFYIDVISTIPLYCFSGLLEGDFEGVFLWNKLLRIFFLFEYYGKFEQRHYVPRHIRWVYLIYVMLFALQLFFAVWWFGITYNQETKLGYMETFEAYVQLLNIFTATGLSSKSNYHVIHYVLDILIVMGTYILVICLVSGFTKMLFMKSYREQKFRKAICIFKNFCSKEQVSKPIVDSSYGYIVQLYQKRDGQQFPKLIMDAPAFIRQDHMESLFGKLLVRTRLFKMAHVDFLRQLQVHLRYEMYLPGSTILEAGDRYRIMYIVEEGEVIEIDNISDGKNNKFNILDAGCPFGELEAITGEPYRYTFKALTVCQILSLNTDDWWYLMEWFPATSNSLWAAIKEFQY